MKKPIRIFLISASAVLGLALVAGMVYILWPGPDTVVVNDTSHSLEFTDCGGGLADVPPGDVEFLNPGAQLTIPSGKFERANVCDVYYADKPDNSRRHPEACLPLPLHDAETITVSQRLKPYTVHSYAPCDMLMKSY